MKKLLLPLLVSLFAIPVFGQIPKGGQPPKSGGKAMNIGRLYGKIVEKTTNDPVAYASVTVLKNMGGGRDSLIGGALTLENGEFNITGLPMGPLKVKINFVGFKSVSKMVRIAPPNDLEQDLGNFKMEADGQLLGEVEVKAEKVLTQISLEKRVFNVEKNITSTGGTAEDVLKSVPSVSVDVDGNAKLRDKNTTIYVDGKPTLMALTQIPADQIESVEVISNPSAKFEASTSGGIVNIVLKKNKKPGYNGMVAVGVGSQGRLNGMVNLNAREGRFNVTGFYNGNSNKNPSEGYAYRTNLNPDGSVKSYFNQNTSPTFDNYHQMGRLGVDYSVNNRNTISLAGIVTTGRFNVSMDQRYELLDAAKQATGSGTRMTEPENNFQNFNIESSWKKTFAQKGKSLIATANYGQGESSNKADWTTTNFDAAGEMLANNPELVKIDGGNETQQLTFQIDYVKPVNDSTKIELGARSFWAGRDQLYLFNQFDYSTGQYVQDETFSLDARITERVNAAYFTYSSRLKYGINYQAGLRFEQSGLTGKSRLADSPSFGYDYPTGSAKGILRTLFPSVFIGKKLTPTSEIGANFSRKINRPNFRQLMPGIGPNDKQNVQYGNPGLEPEFINLAELNYNRIFGANNWLSTIYLSNETNTIKPLSVPDKDDPTLLLTRWVNGENELKYGLDNTLKLAFGKNLELMLNANVFNYNVKVDTFTNTGWAGNGKANLTYKLPADFSFQINGGYEGNRPMPQGNRKGIFFADFAVKKLFFHNMANVTFSINDVFNSRKDIMTLNLPTYKQETMRRRDMRFYKISLQIPFGKADASMFKKRDTKRPAVEDQGGDF